MLRKIRKMLKHQEGFTLVELMIVVVILGILAGIGIQQYGKVQEEARQKAHEANVRIIESAMRMYEMVEGVQPENIDDLSEYLEEVPYVPGTKEEYSIEDGKVVPGFDEPIKNWSPETV